MAQAANVIPFRNEKISFEAAEINVLKVIERYDGHRQVVIFSLSLLAKSSADLKQSFMDVCNTAHLRSDAWDEMIENCDMLARDYEALAGILDTVKSRLSAVAAGHV